MTFCPYYNERMRYCQLKSFITRSFTPYYYIDHYHSYIYKHLNILHHCPTIQISQSNQINSALQLHRNANLRICFSGSAKRHFINPYIYSNEGAI